MTMEKDLRQAARLAGDAADLAEAGQEATLALLLAEMKALTALMPGAMPHLRAGNARAEEARERTTDAEVEALFDNMPV